jgi:hypothetical protein
MHNTVCTAVMLRLHCVRGTKSLAIPNCCMLFFC